ncbi:MAG: DUF1592 domain-containing protein [Deltaproteobacteria bacterium]|nr:DUF1592 domain-containing protein [Deltaproteobacteria bacterium]
MRRVVPLVVSLSLGCGGSSTPMSGADDQGGEGGAPVAPAADCPVDEEVLPARALRLTASQYKRTLGVSFGMDESAIDLPADAFHNDGIVSFNTYADVLTVTAANFSSFKSVANATAPKLALQAKQQHACVFATADDECLNAFVGDFGKRAFRRPLASDEIDRYRELWKSSKATWSADVATNQVLRALLLSPWHLYRTEFGGNEVKGLVQLSAHELANELAYVLTDGPADEELMSLAEKGELSDAEVRRAQAIRLMSTPAGQAKTMDLFVQLYGLDDVLGTPKDVDKFPDFTAKVRLDMRDEARSLVKANLSDGGNGLAGIFDADEVEISGRLARFYGLTSPAADDAKALVKLPEHRRGLLGLGSFLSASSAVDHTSTTKRGLLVLTRFLCGTVPLPPEGAQSMAGKIFAPNTDYTQREHWEFARKSAPECVSCHGQFIPYGLGFEQFDAVGRDRPTEFGKKIDSSVTVDGLADDVNGSYKDTAAMVAKLLTTETGNACFARHARGFLFGAPPGEADACRNQALGKTLKDEGSDVRELVLALVTNPSFVLRKAGN